VVFELLSLGAASYLSQMPKAMEIRARLLHPLENPSGVMPVIEPTKLEMMANTKPRAESTINTIAKLLIASSFRFRMYGSAIQRLRKPPAFPVRIALLLLLF
jgi:hypothetical protein